MRRWEDLRPEFDRRGVAIVTVSGDTPRQIRMGRGLHGLGATMLSDVDLQVTDLYNLRHERGIAPKPGVVVSMPIPTAILVDAAGTVRWIDQAENYQRRSHPDLVLAALEASVPAERPEPR